MFGSVNLSAPIISVIMPMLSRILGEIRPGGIATTGAGDLPCSHIIHIDMHKNADWDSIIGAVLLEADSLKVESIAFPALGTGTLAYCYFHNLTGNVNYNVIS